MAKRKIETRGDTIRALRLRAGLTQRELVEKSGVGLRTIQDMEKGIGAEAFFIDCVASALGLSRSDLVQPLEHNKTQSPEPLPGIPLTGDNQATYGFNTVSAEWHARFAGTNETPEAVNQLFSAVSLMLDRFSPELVEFRYMRHTASLSIGVKLRVEHLHELVRKLIAGELDRIPLEPPGIASIDRILIPAETLSDDASKGVSGGSFYVSFFKLALRSHLEKLAKESQDAETTVTFHADGSAVAERNVAAIVRRLIKQHGATLENPSSPGFISRAKDDIIWPPEIPPVKSDLWSNIRPPEKANFWSPKILPRKPDPWPQLRHGTKPRILVADGNLEAATILATILRKMGHEVQTACDGVEAVQAAADFHPQKVLLSIDLPRMNGYEAMKRIRKQMSKERIEFIAMTKWDREQDRRVALAAGFDQCLIKPLKPAALEQLVELLHD